MGMMIDEHIGVIEDLKSTMSVCMSEPEKTEMCTSLSVAMDIMRKYQKIEDIYYHQTGQVLENSLRALIEDGKID